jgi:hypothetical protein
MLARSRQHGLVGAVRRRMGFLEGTAFSSRASLTLL